MISVIYVDDEPFLLEICKLFLERSGDIQVTTSVSAKNALKILSSRSFDAIISDYQMPGMDGIEFLKVIRKDDKIIPFIIFTGRGREEIVIEALKEGADFYLQKGGDPKAQFAELRNNVEQIVRRRKAESSLVYRETLYRTLFESANDAIVLMEHDRVIECNHRTEDLFSLSSEDLIGHNPVEFSPEYQSDGSLSAKKSVHLLNEALLGIPQLFEWRFLKPDGNTFDTEVSLNRIEMIGTFFLLAIIRDISVHKKILGELEQKTQDLAASYEEILATEEELKTQYDALFQSERAMRMSEEKLRSTLASMDDLVLTLDMNGVFLDAYKENRGDYFISPEVFIGHHYQEVLPPDLSKSLGSAFDQVIASGKTEKITYSMKFNDEIRYFNSKLSIRMDGEGNPAGVTIVARDITEEKKILLELAESKVKLEAVIQSSPIPQFVIDNNHQVIHWNAALSEYSGISDTEIIGTKDQWRAFYPEKRPCLADLLIDEKPELVDEWYKGKYARSELVKGAFEAVDFFPRMGKAGIWLYFTAATIRDNKGEIIGAVETLEDITEQKEAYRKLQHEETILNAVIQVSPVPEFVIDKNHRVMFWNQALSRYSNIPAEEMVGSNQQWRAFYPEERPCLADLLVDNATKEFSTWYNDKVSPSKLIPGAFEASDYFPNLGAEGRWLYFTASPIRDKNGEIIGAVEILEDISEQKRAREELLSVSRYLESIIQNALVFVMVLDVDTNVLIWNTAAEEISGYAASEVIGSRWIWSALYPDPEYRKKITGELVRIISENLFLTNFTTRIRAKDQSDHIITWNTRALRNDDGDITGYVAVGTEFKPCVCPDKKNLNP
ncbi:PAS domain S-box protein [Methanospirillum stamsii]|nr:PAS domain S-box protein [Methanospirillum stamsii]